jgi:hypothetical protein
LGRPIRKAGEFRGRAEGGPEGKRQNQKNNLAAATAVEKPIAAWARENKVSRRTAYPMNELKLRARRATRRLVH